MKATLLALTALVLVPTLARAEGPSCSDQQFTTSPDTVGFVIGVQKYEACNSEQVVDVNAYYLDGILTLEDITYKQIPARTALGYNCAMTGATMTIAARPSTTYTIRPEPGLTITGIQEVHGCDVH